MLIFKAEFSESVLDILLKIFRMEVLIWLENAILKLVFANTVFHKRAILQNLLRRIYRKC